MNSKFNERNSSFPSVLEEEAASTCRTTLNSPHTIKNNKCNSDNKEDNEENLEDCFEIFGLKLHFDDLLIIALLFFLYQEDVKDTYLYIALILLLIS